MGCGASMEGNQRQGATEKPPGRAADAPTITTAVVVESRSEILTPPGAQVTPRTRLQRSRSPVLSKAEQAEAAFPSTAAAMQQLPNEEVKQIRRVLAKRLGGRQEILSRSHEGLDHYRRITFLVSDTDEYFTEPKDIDVVSRTGSASGDPAAGPVLRSALKTSDAFSDGARSPSASMSNLLPRSPTIIPRGGSPATPPAALPPTVFLPLALCSPMGGSATPPAARSALDGGTGSDVPREKEISSFSAQGSAFLLPLLSSDCLLTSRSVSLRIDSDASFLDDGVPLDNSARSRKVSFFCPPADDQGNSKSSPSLMSCNAL